jgi:sugar phosphate isomerase/epimerase
MGLGMPTLVAHESLAEDVALARELGLSFVEINMNLPMYQGCGLPSGRDDVYFTLHLDEALNPFDFNALVAEAYKKTALDAVRAARAADMPVVNMHMPMGVHFKLPGRKVHLFDRYWDAVKGRIERFRDEMDRAAGGAVSVCVENTTFGGFSHLSDALDLLLLSPAFSLTYDCGHDLTDLGRAGGYYAARAERVRHIHLHDACGADCHLPLGTGEIDVPAVLQMACGGRAVLETKDEPGLRASVKWLFERNLIPC